MISDRRGNSSRAAVLALAVDYVETDVPADRVRQRYNPDTGATESERQPIAWLVPPTTGPLIER